MNQKCPSMDTLSGISVQPGHKNTSNVPSQYSDTSLTTTNILFLALSLVSSFSLLRSGWRQTSGVQHTTTKKSNHEINKSQPALTFNKQRLVVIRLTSDWGSNIASHSDWRSNNTIHPAQETQPGSSQSCLFELWITTCSVIQQPLGHLVILHKPGEENGKRNVAPGNEQTQEP